MTNDAPEHEVQRRFADMDLLGHVNNVRFLDYVTSAREELLRDAGLGADRVRVTGHRIGFEAPMVFGRAPAVVRSWVSAVEDGGLTVAQELASHGHRGDGPREVHLRTETRLAGPTAGLGDLVRGEGHHWRDVVASERPARHELPVQVRARDLGRDGAVRDDALLEYLQESRVRYFMDLHTPGEEWSSQVVARTDLELPHEVRADAECRVRSWVAHVGRSSYVVRADLAVGEVVHASATVVMVAFDPATQRATAMAPAQRERLQQELAG